MADPTDPQIAAGRLRTITSLRPSLAFVLGSGFNDALGGLEIDKEILCVNLPGFPGVHIDGHAGKVVIGWLGKTEVIVLQGRAHYYEGHSMAAITFPVRVLAQFGVRTLLLTNAAGGINPRLQVGDFMCLTDHINFMGTNPLRPSLALAKEHGFLDLTETYDARLRRLLRRAARDAGIRLRTGVYLAVSGPSYETPAEIRAFARLGADAVGMSTVPEAIVARQCGLDVLAVSSITNLAAGRASRGLLHEDVLRTGQKIAGKARLLLETFAKMYAKFAEKRSKRNNPRAR